MKDLFSKVEEMESGQYEEQVIFRSDDPFYVKPAEEENVVEQIDNDLDRDRRWGKIARALYVRNRM